MTRPVQPGLRVGLGAPELTVVWHAGEPLVAAVAFYREAFATIERMRPRRCSVTHSFQTNGTLIDEEWCDLFRGRSVGVGVSIDGPQHCTTAIRMTRCGTGHVRQDHRRHPPAARHEGAVPRDLGAVARQPRRCRDELFDFYIAEGIDHVCFNVEESRRRSRLRAVRRADDPQRALLPLPERVLAPGAGQRARFKFMREIEHAMPARIPARRGSARQHPGRAVRDGERGQPGNVSSFSPELLGLKQCRLRRFPARQHQPRLAGGRSTRRCAVSALLRRHPGRRRRRAARAAQYFSRLRRRRAGQQAVREWLSSPAPRPSYCTLCILVPTDLILEAYDRLEQQLAPKRFPRPLRSSQPLPRTRLAATEDAMTRSQLFACASLPGDGRVRRQMPRSRPAAADATAASPAAPPGPGPDRRARAIRARAAPQNAEQTGRPAVAGGQGDQRRGAAFAEKSAAWTSFVPGGSDGRLRTGVQLASHSDHPGEPIDGVLDC